MTTSTHKQIKTTFKGLQDFFKRAELEFKAWQGHEVKSNDALYKTLAVCLELATSDDSKNLKKTLKKIAGENDLSFNDGTSVFGFAVKLVFNGIDRAKTSAYASVLKKAHEADIDFNELPDWIRDKGGIEKVRTEGSESKADAAKAKREKALEEAKDVIDDGYTAGFNILAPNKGKWKFETNKNSKTAVWFVHEASDGSFDLLSIHMDSELVKSIATKYGEALKAEDASKLDIKVVSKAVTVTTTESDDAIVRAAKKQ